MSMNTKFIKKLAAGFCIVLFIAAGNAFAQKISFQIIPGVKAGAITARTSEADLRRIYGSRNVRYEDVGIGEGETVPGAMIFPNDPLRRLSIVWKNPKQKKNPEYVQFSGDKSLWQTTQGITLGTSLKTLERLNGGGFSLLGFQWDYSGTIVSWKGGRLSRTFGKESELITIRLSPKYDNKALEKDYEAVIGDGEFSSKNKSMQRINPQVYFIVVNLR